MAGGGSSVQSAPEYVQEFHSWAIQGADDQANGIRVQKSLAEYMNEYLVGSASDLAGKNPYAVYEPNGTPSGTIYPRLYKTDAQSWQNFIEQVDIDRNSALWSTIYNQMTALDGLMNSEAEDIMNVASKGYDALKEKYPEIDINAITDIVNITSDVLMALNAFINDPSFDALIESFNTRNDQARDEQVAKMKNSLGMLDSSMSSAFAIGVGLIHEEATKQSSEYLSNLQGKVVVEHFKVFIDQYFKDHTTNRLLKTEVVFRLGDFVSKTFFAKLNLNATRHNMIANYLQVGLKTYADVFNFYHATRQGFLKWPYEVYQMGGNYMSTVLGGNLPVSHMGPLQSAFSGALAGAGISASVGFADFGLATIAGAVGGYFTGEES